MRRQADTQRLVIEVGVHVGEDRARRLDPPDPVQRVRDAEMARMRHMAQRIDDPEVESGERRDTGLRHVVQVARIRDVAEPEPERLDVAVILRERISIGPPGPGIDSGTPALSSCMLRIGGYSLPAGCAKQYANRVISMREVASSA